MILNFKIFKEGMLHGSAIGQVIDFIALDCYLFHYCPHRNCHMFCGGQWYDFLCRFSINIVISDDDDRCYYDRFGGNRDKEADENLIDRSI